MTNPLIPTAFKTLSTIAALISLSACTTVKEVRQAPDGSYKKSVSNVPYAAAAPLRDLNIGTPDIPEKLKGLTNPYDVSTLKSCKALLQEAQALDASIAEANTADVGMLHKSDTRAGKLGNAADVTTKALATSVMPFRGVVRLASGATKKEKEMSEAEKAGRERLGFLIGLGSANHCYGFNTEAPNLR